MQKVTPEPIYNLDEYYTELKFKLQKSSEIARKILIEQKIKRTQNLNNNLNPIDVSVGDLVYLSNENRKKLEPHFIGPFKIKEVDNIHCKIIDISNKKEIQVHKNRIIKM